jgi:hypothetical protein
LQGLTTLLTHQPLGDFTVGCGTRLRCLLDHLRAQAMDLLKQADGAKKGNAPC